jgi:hypothetical protein
MSLEELMKPQDIRVFVGAKGSQVKGGDRVALCVIDFGAQSPSAYDAMCMHQKINLDIQPSRTGHMYYVTSGKIAVDVSSDVFTRALSSESPAKELANLSRSGTPLFNTCVEVTEEEQHLLFTDARAAFEGCWVLVVLAEDATEMLILPDGLVYVITLKRREEYQFE